MFNETKKGTDRKWKFISRMYRLIVKKYVDLSNFMFLRCFCKCHQNSVLLRGVIRGRYHSTYPSTYLMRILSNGHLPSIAKPYFKHICVTEAEVTDISGPTFDPDCFSMMRRPKTSTVN